MRYQDIFAATGIALLLAVVAGCGGDKPVKPEQAASAQQPSGNVDLAKGQPPWPLPTQSSKAYIDAAGLPLYTQEKTLVHYHAHLDVSVDGQPVQVPADIGIAFENGQPTAISPLHTHDTSGVIHVEAGENAKFTLGQLFTEWGLRLDQECIGGMCQKDGKELRYFVNGVAYDGDPVEIPIREHEEIAILYGKPDQLPKPPSTYDFGNL